IALAEQDFAAFIGDALAGEGEQLQLRRLDLREERNPPQQLDLFLETHSLPPSARPAPGVIRWRSARRAPSPAGRARQSFPAPRAGLPPSPGRGRNGARGWRGAATRR